MALCRHSPHLRLALLWISALALVAAPASAGPGAQVASDGLAALSQAAGEIDELVANAHFRTAVAVAEKTRRWASEIPSSPEVREVRAQIEVLLATAQVALGETDGARASLASALRVWPLLSLDTRSTSPRVVEVFREVRASAAAARRGP